MTLDRDQKDCSVIREDMTLEGDLVCKSDVQVDGEIKGNITCVGLFVSKAGRVTGDVSCEIVEVEGTLNGVVTATRVELLAGCSLDGEIVSETLSIDHGAAFTGSARPQKGSKQRDVREAAE